jgi:hypothetical protein
MTPEEEMKNEIISKFGDRFNLTSEKIKIVIQHDVPARNIIGKDSTTLEFLGKVEKYFVYVVKKAFIVISILCTMIDIAELPTKVSVFLPKSYEFIKNVGKELINGNYDQVREKNNEDGFLVIRRIWLTDEKTYNKAYNNLTNGDLNSLQSSDAVLTPATGSVISTRTYKVNV